MGRELAEKHIREALAGKDETKNLTVEEVEHAVSVALKVLESHRGNLYTWDQLADLGLASVRSDRNNR